LSNYLFVKGKTDCPIVYCGNLCKILDCLTWESIIKYEYQKTKFLSFIFRKPNSYLLNIVVWIVWEGFIFYLG